jgi:hypothetical protein
MTAGTLSPGTAHAVCGGNEASSALAGFQDCHLFSARSSKMAEEPVQLTRDQYRKFVAIQYLNASAFLFEGMKSQQGKNDFHFVVTMRSFVEYTRRGIWFLAWATDKQLRDVNKLLYRRMLGEELRNIWKMLGTIHNQPDTMRTNVQIAAHLVKQAGLSLP